MAVQYLLSSRARVVFQVINAPVSEREPFSIMLEIYTLVIILTVYFRMYGVGACDPYERCANKHCYTHACELSVVHDTQ